MLNIKFIRENPDIVKKDLEKRDDREKLKWINDLLEKDKIYRDLLQKSQELRRQRNIINLEINQLKKQGKDISTKLAAAKNLPGKIKETEEDIKKVKEKIDFYLMRLPNILHSSVPFGTDETGNKKGYVDVVTA